MSSLTETYNIGKIIPESPISLNIRSIKRGDNNKKRKRTYAPCVRKLFLDNKLENMFEQLRIQK
jgi:hypothetical protein